MAKQWATNWQDLGYQMVGEDHYPRDMARQLAKEGIELHQLPSLLKEDKGWHKVPVEKGSDFFQRVDLTNKEPKLEDGSIVTSVKRVLGTNDEGQLLWCRVMTKHPDTGKLRSFNVFATRQGVYQRYKYPCPWPITWKKELCPGLVAIKFLDLEHDPRYITVLSVEDFQTIYGPGVWRIDA